MEWQLIFSDILGITDPVRFEESRLHNYRVRVLVGRCLGQNSHFTYSKIFVTISFTELGPHSSVRS